MDHKRVFEMDRISGFPDGILHHILSFLPQKDAFRMSVLSKRWKLLVDTYPNLDFRWFDFIRKDRGLNLAASSEERDDKRQTVIKEFISYVDASLFRFCKHKYSIQKFKLSLLLLPNLRLDSILEGWLRLVIDKGVQEIWFTAAHRNARCNLPEFVFSAPSVTSLILCGFNVFLNDSFHIRMHSLRQLCLQSVLINDHVVTKLASCCPLLEDISLRVCCGLKKIQVVGLPRLKKFNVMSTFSGAQESIEIASPSLVSCCLSLISFRSESLQPIIKLDACQALKRLTLSGSFFTEQLLERLVSKFLVLERLTVAECQSLKRLKISSQSLESLLLYGCPSLVDIKIDSPNLLHGQYHGSARPFCSINATSCLWKAEIALEQIITLGYIMKLKEFLTKLNQVEYLYIFTNLSIQISFDLEDLSKNSSPLAIENVVLRLLPAVPSSVCAALMDGLFWFIHPNNLYMTLHDIVHMTSEEAAFYTQFFARGDLSCCNHRKPQCWRHDLEEVQVESVENNGNRISPQNKMIPPLHGRICFHCKLKWKL